MTMVRVTGFSTSPMARGLLGSTFWLVLLEVLFPEPVVLLWADNQTWGASEPVQVPRTGCAFHFFFLLFFIIPLLRPA